MTAPSANFDTALAAGYEAWYRTPEGRAADAQEKATLRRLLRHFAAAPSVLEVGTGTGHFTRWLREAGLAATGLDLSTAMLAQARALGGAPWVQGDAYRLPFATGAFDLVAFITTLEFLPRPRQALREALRVARHGLLLGVLNRWSPLGIRRRLEGLTRPSVYDAAHFYGVKELTRLVRSLAGAPAQLVGETTLLPAWWPGWLPDLGWGGFIGMALILDPQTAPA